MTAASIASNGHLWVRNQRAGEVLPRIRHGAGAYLIDETGKRYLDGSGGPVLSCIGHGNREVIDAIKEQLDRFEFAFCGHFTTDAIDALAETIVAEAGPPYHRVSFVSGGSEAIETCMRIALEYHVARGESGRAQFISRRQSWHGYTFGALSVSGHFMRRRHYAQALIPATFLSPANVYRPPSGIAPDDLPQFCADEFERAILTLGPERVAAFIFEPVTGTAGGAVPAPPGYARAMRRVCDRYGVLMISDEVMCGVGRCGTWRALEQDGVASDLMAIAKGMGGGYMPIGAAVYTEAIYQTIVTAHGTVGTAHTYAGHPVACAAALAVQRVMKREGLVEKVRRDGTYLRTCLEQALAGHDHVGDIRGRGLLLAAELVMDKSTKQPFPRALQLHAKVREQSFANGLICFPSGGTVDGINGDHILLAPPYTATREELDAMVSILASSVDQVFGALGRDQPLT